MYACFFCLTSVIYEDSLTILLSLLRHNAPHISIDQCYSNSLLYSLLKTLPIQCSVQCVHCPAMLNGLLGPSQEWEGTFSSLQYVLETGQHKQRKKRKYNECFIQCFHLVQMDCRGNSSHGLGVRGGIVSTLQYVLMTGQHKQRNKVK